MKTVQQAMGHQVQRWTTQECEGTPWRPSERSRTNSWALLPVQLLLGISHSDTKGSSSCCGLPVEGANVTEDERSFGHGFVPSSLVSAPNCRLRVLSLPVGIQVSVPIHVSSSSVSVRIHVSVRQRRVRDHVRIRVGVCEGIAIRARVNILACSRRVFFCLSRLFLLTALIVWEELGTRASRVVNSSPRRDHHTSIKRFAQWIPPCVHPTRHRLLDELLSVRSL